MKFPSFLLSYGHAGGIGIGAGHGTRLAALCREPLQRGRARLWPRYRQCARRSRLSSSCIPCICRSISSTPGSMPGCCRTSAQALREIIEARIATRKPAAYLTNEACIQGHSFFVDERVIVPRSYIGELLCSRWRRSPVGAARPIPDAIERVLDLCTGWGCLAILAALAFPSAERRCQRRICGCACRRRAQCARLRSRGPHLAHSAPICSPPLPAAVTI